MTTYFRKAHKHLLLLVSHSTDPEELSAIGFHSKSNLSNIVHPEEAMEHPATIDGPPVTNKGFVVERLREPTK